MIVYHWILNPPSVLSFVLALPVFILPPTVGIAFMFNINKTGRRIGLYLLVYPVFIFLALLLNFFLSFIYGAPFIAIPLATVYIFCLVVIPSIVITKHIRLRKNVVTETIPRFRHGLVMSVVTLTFLAVLLTSALVPRNPTPSAQISAWAATGAHPRVQSTHQFITGKALDILELNGLTGLSNQRRALKRYSDQPDFTQMRQYGSHMVVGPNGQAVQKMNYHFKLAIQNASIKDLGYAIHYLSDLSTPAHAADIHDTVFLPSRDIRNLFIPRNYLRRPHFNYEQWVIRNQNSIPIPKDDFNHIGIFRTQELTDSTIDSLIYFSASFGSLIVRYERNGRVYRYVTAQVLPVVIFHVAALMEQFIYATGL